MTHSTLEQQKQMAQTWFEALQEKIISHFEELEETLPSPATKTPSARFIRSPWQRTNEDGSNGGGGRMALMQGRFFEKVGVHTSTVYGEFSPQFRGQIPGTEESPAFWATGISLIAHPRSPNVPTSHFNTRFITTGKSWFGGGGDLTPMLDIQRTQDHPNTKAFHKAFEECCQRHNKVANYERYKKWCDEYFFLPHRNEMRGIGGIFYDHLNSGSFSEDFAFTQDVGESFLASISQIMQTTAKNSEIKAEREQQLKRRGRYVEFNLLYDKGTLFGLKTGGNIESILSSMPPLAKW